MSKGPARLFTPEQELEICAYYWTRLDTGYYPSYGETAQHFGCSGPLIKLILKRNKQPRRTNAETREHRPCKPIVRHAPPGEPTPLCACGCGQSVEWDISNYRWFKYTQGHYSGLHRKIVQPTYAPNTSEPHPIRPDHEFRPRTPRARPVDFHPLHETIDREQLDRLYTKQHHTIPEVADILEIGPSTVKRALKFHGIRIRTLSESLILRGSTRGEKNPAWKGGVAEWEYSSDWKRICKAIKDRDQWTCQHCGECRKHWGVHLHVHHIDGNKLNNHPDNLISLCAKCHRLAHNPQREGHNTP